MTARRASGLGCDAAKGELHAAHPQRLRKKQAVVVKTLRISTLRSLLKGYSQAYPQGPWINAGNGASSLGDVDSMEEVP